MTSSTLTRSAALAAFRGATWMALAAAAGPSNSAAAPAPASTPAAVAAAPAATAAAPANARLRFACDEGATGAQVHVDGKFRGECPFDASVAAGSLKIRAVQKVDERTERIFEQEIRVGEDTAKRVDIVLGPARLNAAAQQVLDERRRAQERERAELQRVRAEAKRLEIEAGLAVRGKADAGDVASMLALSKRYREGLGVDRSDEQAMIWLRKAADAGDANAMARVAEAYELGEGLPRDMAQAFALYEKSAALGDPVGIGGLAAMYNNGTGTPADPLKAVEWAQKGVAVGNGRAMLNLSIHHRAGTGGLAVNAIEADRLLEQAIQTGETRVLLHHGIKLLIGPADGERRGFEMIQRAYENSGSKTAAAYLGVSYAEGWGVPKSDEKALPYYRIAVEAGNSTAMNNLGQFYTSGRGGLKVDQARGIELYRQAALLGNKTAIGNLKALGQPVPVVQQ